MSSASSSPPALLVYIIGATGVGKTAASVELCRCLRERLHYSSIHVINGDAMQFYQGLPIATNKTCPSELVFTDGSPIPHHFMSFLSLERGRRVCEPGADYATVAYRASSTDDGSSQACSPKLYTVHDYVSDVNQFLREKIFAGGDGSGVAVIVCGGSNYYIQSLMFNGTLINATGETAQSSDDVNDASGTSGTWDDLNAIDPVAAQHVHPNNIRRIVRLLEIAKHSNGKVPSAIFKEQVDSDSGGIKVQLNRMEDCVSGGVKVSVLWVDGERQWLNERLDARVDDMISNGLVDEVRHFRDMMERLQQSLPGDSKRSRQEGCDNDNGNANDHFGSISTAIGFREWEPFLKSSSCDGEGGENLNLMQSCCDAVKSRTRRYARQQEQWIRNRFLGLYLPQWQAHGVPFLRIDMTRLLREAPQYSHSSSLFGDVVQHVAQRVVALPDAEPPPSIIHSIVHEEAVAVAAGSPADDAALLKRKLFHCKHCEQTLSGEIQWELHLKSKAHRGALRHEQLVEEQKLLGRVIPPRKKKQ